MKSASYLWKGLALGLLVSVVACEVTSEKIAVWKQSQNGAPKIRAALRDTDQAFSVRVEAAEALAELGLFLPLADDFAALQAPDRQKILGQLSQHLVDKMKGANPSATTRVQIQAKDALFSLRELFSPEERRALDLEVVGWIIGDWNARREGEHSASKIIERIGEPAGPVLAAALGQNPALSVPLATLLGKVGAPAVRDEGAGKLIAQAKTQSPVAMGTIQALGNLHSKRALEYLKETVTKGKTLETRVWAMRALALSPDPSLVQFAKSVAADESLKGPEAVLRDDAFTVLEKVQDPASVDALATFLADKEDPVRYRAVEALLAGFGAQGLGKLLEELPSSYTYKKQDVIDFIESDILKLGAEALPPLRKALRSNNWIARLIAVRVLGKIGTAQDIDSLQELAGDATILRGWDHGILGNQAQAAADALKKRKN